VATPCFYGQGAANVDNSNFRTQDLLGSAATIANWIRESIWQDPF